MTDHDAAVEGMWKLSVREGAKKLWDFCPVKKQVRVRESGPCQAGAGRRMTAQETWGI